MARTIPVVQPGTTPGALPPVFERIGIVGLGLIGGSIALACRRTWPTCLVIGVDRNEVIERAVVRHAIDVAADDLGMLREAQLVVLAAPVLQNVALLATLPEHVPGAAIVTDVGSTKRAMGAAAAALPARLRFIGGHPLAGAARAGIDHASPDIFQGRPWILTPVGTATTSGDLDGLVAWVRALGADPRVMPADAHDRLMAFVSHLPQLTASALMRVIGEAAGGEGLALAGRGLADTTRLASSPASVWADICASNADEIGAALDALVATLQELRAHLHDPGTVERVFAAAAAWRRHLGRQDPGPSDR